MKRRIFSFLLPFSLFAGTKVSETQIKKIVTTIEDEDKIVPYKGEASFPFEALIVKQLFVNGLLQEPGLDYTFANNTVTFLNPADRFPEDRIRIFSRK